MDAPNRESVVQRVGFRLTLLLKPPNSRNQWKALEERRHTPWEESLAGTCLKQCMTEPSNGDTVPTVHGARPKETTLSRIVTKVIV